MKQYEAVVILKPELDGEALQIVMKEIMDLFKKKGSEVSNVEEWGKRALAYPIAKKKEGLFFLVRFAGAQNQITAITREFTLNENIIRSMVVACQ